MSPWLSVANLALYLLSNCILSLGSHQRYIINNSKCKLPDIDPFSEESSSFYVARNYTNCTKLPLLTYISKFNNTAILHIREDIIKDYSSGGVNCCYSNITRNESSIYPDLGIELSECSFFQKHVTLHHDNVMVKCTYNDTLVYENIHNPIIIKDFVREKLEEGKTNAIISVLMIVIDSISRLNVIRAMPKTYQYLRDNNFIEMEGYTKINDNTYPNFMGAFAGLNLNQSLKLCSPYERSKLDECSLIWYDYRNLGYVTAYAEDYDSINTFTWSSDMKGFTKPPTDYYLKSYFAAAEQLKLKKTFQMPFCTGPESSAERVLNLAKDFSETFRNNPSFGVFWMNSFSHNEVNSPSMIDEKMEEFFKDLMQSGLLDDRIVIFLSDHGVRFGEVRFTNTGWLEERMPVSMISVPVKFQKRFRREFKNLQENANKLTNHYDLFMTLQHILRLSGISYKIKQSRACPRCKSLFEEIPEERSCQDAGIDPEWCICGGYFQPISQDSEYVINATTYCNNENCKDLTVEKIVSSSISELDPSDGFRYLFVILETSIGRIYLMTVKFKDQIDNDSFFHILKFSF